MLLTRSFALSSARLDSRALELLAAIVFAGAFAGFTMLVGVPALRHDWAWPSASAQIHQWIVLAWTGWRSDGIGTAAPYPSSYLIAVPVYALLMLFGPYLALAIFLFCIGAAVALGARALAKECGAHGMAAIGLMAFALFNPWVYTKTVAGHVIMVLAYGATMHLGAQLMRRRLRWTRLAFALVLAYAQVQFFVIGLALLLLRARSRDAWKAMAFGVLLFLPTIVGVAGNFHALAAVPYTLAWQRSQSVAPLDAFLLDGYFAQYTAHIHAPAFIAVSIALLLAFWGLVCKSRADRGSRVQGAAVAIIGLAAILFATGTKGAIAPIYSGLVNAAPASGLFRELYDLLGFAAAAYIALAAAGTWNTVARAGALAAGLCALSCWVLYPPSEFFVPRSAVPEIGISAAPHTRYALYPAFQPMSYEGKGSGTDPDVYSRPGGVTPLNTYDFTYPASPALEQYARTGDTAILSALSVSSVVIRPTFSTDAESFNARMGGPVGANTPPKSAAILPLPELSIIASPAPFLAQNRLGSGNIFFGDAEASGAADSWRSLPAVKSVKAPNASADLRHGWVDALFGFLQAPQAAQGLGGAATSDSRAVLKIADGRYVLAYVRGKLIDGRNRVLAHDTAGYRWLEIVQDRNASLRCDGFCIVAAKADRIPALLPAQASSKPYRAVTFQSPLPWLAIAHISANARGWLRYNVTYDRSWTAFAQRRMLRHARIDEAVNGWQLPRSGQGTTVILVHVVSALQMLFEFIGICAVALLGVLLAREVRVA